ncbi:lithostathine-like isoform X1 [Echinops telfairi]|uniref:Lithostathine-like isoform X1 n=1 Tax=Echinops telfairi TaxID=9371 RepID=A0ABM0J3C3_ECHTE|nr:lithostathine-like isoform X1 [Echinops telfairi]
MPSPMALPSLSWILLSSLVILSQVQGEDSPMELPSERISCPKGSKAYGSYCYALFLTPKPWTDADIACQKRPSGHLVSVLSAAEGSFVASLVKSTSNTKENIWIGFHDPTMGSEPDFGGWEWSSTDLVTYSAWDEETCSNSSPDFCASLSANKGFQKWQRYGCEKALPYVCKFKD